MSNAIGNNGGRLYSFGSQPVLIDCNFVVDHANGNGLGISSLKGQGVKNVYMYTSATPARGVGQTIVNPMGQTASKGYALIQLRSNYNRYLGGFSGFVSPVTGSALNIDASDAALTVGNPYVIVSPGAGPSGVATIAPVGDSSGSLAGKYFMLYDSYGNSFCIWFNVSGVGSAPNLGPAVLPGQRGLQYVQQSIASGDSAATIGAALVLTIENLQSGVNGVYSFTASGSTTVTVTSTAAAPIAIPQDGSSVIPDQGPAVPIIFTVSSASATSGAIYTDGSGHLYTVTTTLASGTTLKTSGVGVPLGSTLTKVSGTGDASITFSAAVTGYATAFSFALTVSDTNLGDWQAVGLMPGLTPTIGQSFIATATGAGHSTGQVKAAGVSGIMSMEVIGDPNQSFAPAPQGLTAHPGGWILVQFLAPTISTGAYVSPFIPTAPADGSVIGMSFYVDQKFSPSNIGL